MAYKVIIPLVIVDAGLVNEAELKNQYFYQGAVLPKSVAKKDIDRLLKLGAIAVVKTDVVLSTDVLAIDKGNELFDPTVEEDGGEGAPAQSATKGDWVDYAVSKGADETEAESMTKADLIAAYGS